MEQSEELVRLDLGCGTNKRSDGNWIGVDRMEFPNVDKVLDLTVAPWPWEDESVDEVHCSHFVEHLIPSERITFVNELFRILRPGAKATIITPHWASGRAFGDLTHQFPPVCEMWYCYLNKAWRDVNAPHNTNYACDFDHSYGWSTHPEIQARNQEFQNLALMFFKEACQDLIATVIKRA